MSEIFKRFDFRQAPNADTGPAEPQGFRGAFHAIAIDPRSDMDACLVDGQVVSVGSPIYLDGVERTYQIESFRYISGVTRLVGVVNPCGLGALPMHRVPFRYQEDAVTHSALRQIHIVVPGRRHLSIAARGEINDVFRFYAYRNARSGQLFKASFFVITLAATNTTEFWEIGGTNEEECFDEYYIDVEVAAAPTTTRLWVEAYGELGR